MNFTALEARILDRVQRDFPSTATPLADMAVELGMPERDFLSSLGELKSDGIVRNISGIFNASRLGYASCLVAFVVSEKSIEQAAAQINMHPGVSHNYLRDHHYNIWFTLASDSEKRLDKTVKILAGRCGASDYIQLRNERLIKIGLMLPVGESGGPEASAAAVSEHDTETVEPADRAYDFSDREKESIRLLQMDLPIEEEPFGVLLKTAGSAIGADVLVDDMIKFKKHKILRRYSGVLRHRKAGYRSNAMTVWKPAKDADMSLISEVFSRVPSISHLYLRTVHPGRWEYPLFAMIHARSDGELEGITEKLARESGISDYRSLRTLKEFKKERVVYYSPQFKEWDRQAGL